MTTLKAMLLSSLLAALTACAFRVGGHPFRVEGVVLYGRATDDCVAGEVPPQLVPQTLFLAPDLPAVAAVVKCDTLEVGAKSYSDTIAAIGTALAAMGTAALLF